MFTGLIEVTGRVEAVETTPTGAMLLIRPDSWDHRPAHGDSISINGCCLTVANHPDREDGGLLRFDVIPQTLRMTALGDLKTGDLVNLEHAATPGTLLGGHLVQGHVDGVGTARRVNADGAAGEWRMRITPPPAIMDLIVPQGSVTVNGVSLTIATVRADSFDVTLIPTTLEKTNLGRITAEVEMRINLEADYLVRAVQHLLQRAGKLP